MIIEELTELFIHAAEVDRRLPVKVGPQSDKSMSLPFVHDRADKNGWGSDRLEEERQEFFERIARWVSADDVSSWERALDLMLMVPDDSQRRCLWHWSIAKAGGWPFAKWCRKREDIHEETGRRRKDRALFCILTRINCVNGDFTHENDAIDLLPVGAEISDKQSIIGAVTAWIAPGYRPEFCDIDRDLERYDWAEEQNARRRERDRKRRAA